MAGSPRWKIYSPTGGYVAACKHAEDAAAVVALHGDGATIRDGHAARNTVWTEGRDGAAGESYDEVATACEAKLAVNVVRTALRSRGRP